MSELRLICTSENAGSEISGKLFASVEIGGAEVHVSERMTEEDAAPFLRNAHLFRAFDGPADAEEAIDRALEDARAALAAAGAPAGSAAKDREISELIAANQRQAAANRELREELETLRSTNPEKAKRIKSLEKERDEATASVQKLTEELTELRNQKAQLVQENAKLMAALDAAKAPAKSGKARVAKGATK